MRSVATGFEGVGEFDSLLDDFERGAKYCSQQVVMMGATGNSEPKVQSGFCASRRDMPHRPSSAACVRDVALDVWALLGFFTSPPDEREGMEPPEVVEQEALDRDVLDFVSALEAYYTQVLKVGGLPSCQSVSGVCGGVQHALPSKRLGCREVRNGVWRVLFNAVFYCASASGHIARWSTPDASDASRSPTQSNSSEESGGENRNLNHGVPTRLRWKQRERGDKKAIGTNQIYQCGTTRGRGGAPTHFAAQECQKSTMVSASTVTYRSRRQNVPTCLQSRDTVPFTVLLDSPLPTISWHFISYTLSQLGYRRDTFYVQTPLDASVHELMLALLWLTKEYQLVAVAEHVKMQCAYPFLLEQLPEANENAVSGSVQNQPPPPTDGARSWKDDHAVGYKNTELLDQHRADVLLRSFPAAIPWPPASFMERENIAYRLRQQELIIPSCRGGLSSSPCRLTDITRELLSARRLIELAVGRLEQILHQRVEQSIALGPHSDLDVQVCHPAMHSAYHKLCCGLRHALSFEKRLRHITDQLASLGSLVAWSVHFAEPCPDGCCNYGELYNPKDVMEAMMSDDVVATRAACEAVGRPLQNALKEFRASQRLEQLGGMCAFLRRRAKLSNEQSVEDDVILRTKVQRNMRARYSLRAALSAQLMAMAEAKRTSCSDVQSIRPPKVRGAILKFFNVVSTSQDSCSEVGTGASLSSSTASNPANGGNDVFIESNLARRAQSTVVGPPVGGGTTSARLEVERLGRERLQLAVGVESVDQHGQPLADAARTLRHHRLRVVPRITKHRSSS